MGFLWALLMPALIVAAGIRQTWRRFQLARRSNVHFLGVKGVDELAAYAQHVDACIMPYRTTPYAECIYPLKLRVSRRGTAGNRHADRHAEGIYGRRSSGGEPGGMVWPR